MKQEKPGSRGWPRQEKSWRGRWVLMIDMKVGVWPWKYEGPRWEDPQVLSWVAWITSLSCLSRAQRGPCWALSQCLGWGRCSDGGTRQEPSRTMDGAEGEARAGFFRNRRPSSWQDLVMDQSVENTYAECKPKSWQGNAMISLPSQAVSFL